VSLPAWLLLSSGLLAAAVALGLVARRVGLQLTVVLVVVGFAARLVGDAVDLEIPLEGEGFEEVVVFLFLPVLVFEAALGLSVRAFFRNLGPILMLAVVALLASAALVGGALALVLGTPLTAALLFGALISATDPVAVVAVFRQLGVPERLLVLVEGRACSTTASPSCCSRSCSAPRSVARPAWAPGSSSSSRCSSAAPRSGRCSAWPPRCCSRGWTATWPPPSPWRWPTAASSWPTTSWASRASWQGWRRAS
jgi:hypothetical protein